METGAPLFPPLLTGLAAAESDLLAAAIRAAEDGADGGTVLWSPLHAPGSARWEAAMILAPETPLSEALTAVFALQMAAVDAIGALARPELGITWAWPDILLANGAAAGRMRVAASDPAPDQTPDWLAIAFALDLAPMGDAPGETPDRTTLAEEGCPELGGAALTEVWARHALLWLHRWMESGLRAVEPHWRDRAFGAGEDERGAALAFDGATGRFLGVDEEGGLLLRLEDEKVAHRPLSIILERSQRIDPPRLRTAAL